MPTTPATAVEPPPQALLSLREDDDSAPLGSRLRGTRDGVLVVEVPSDDEFAAPLDAPVPGRPLTVSWAAHGGVTRAPAAFVGVGDDEGHPVWLLRITGEPDVSQRREYFRGRAEGELSVTAGVGQVQARILDLSEGGVRCRLKGPTPAPPGETVTVTIHVGEAPIVVDAVVIRATPSLDERTELALRFVDLGERAGDVIRRHLFELQLRERRNGLS